VASRPDLAERVAEFAARVAAVDDIAECWGKITDSRQERKRDRIAEAEFLAPYSDENPSAATDQPGSEAAGESKSHSSAMTFDVE
jgi:hypothetical protein